MMDSSSAAYWTKRAQQIVSPYANSITLQNVIKSASVPSWVAPQMLQLAESIKPQSYAPSVPVKLLATDFTARQAKLMQGISAPPINALKTDLFTNQALAGIIANNTTIGSQFRFGSVKSLLGSIEIDEIEVDEVDELSGPWELNGVIDEEFANIPEEVRETLSSDQASLIKKTIQAMITIEMICVAWVACGGIPALAEYSEWVAAIVNVLPGVQQIPKNSTDWAEE